MMELSFAIRPADIGDVPDIVALQLLCYGADFHEDAQAFANKITQPDNLCWVAENTENGTLLAYMMSVRATMQHFPCLNMLDYQQPPQGDTLYLHDMAIAPSARGKGIKHQLLNQVLQQAQALQLQQALLVAVQGAQPVWEKQGFQVIDAAEFGLQQVLASYGKEAVLMGRDINTSTSQKGIDTFTIIMYHLWHRL